MDISIPLGIIVNELISNSLKHAFNPGQKGEICIIIHKIYNRADRNSADYEPIPKLKIGSLNL